MINKMFKAYLAGMAIALGGWAYLSAPNPLVGAVLFACGLLTVRLYKLHLFTGKVQFMVTKNERWYYYPLILIFNFIGVLLIVLISYETIHEPAMAIAEAKAAQPIWIALVKGFGCGVLMSLATYEKTPLWVTVLAVATFILAGFNHCIADFYYMVAGRKLSINLLLTILGNICGGTAINAQLIKDEP